jgi:hypothetical protein
MVFNEVGAEATVAAATHVEFEAGDTFDTRPALSNMAIRKS